MSLLSDIGTAIKNKLGGTSVDNTVPRYDGTTCKLQGSGVTISDTNAVTASGGFVGNLTGNAATATKLATARTINGVSFDGTANINIETGIALNDTLTSISTTEALTANQGKVLKDLVDVKLNSTNPSITGSITEDVYNLVGTDINPTNGTIQYKTISANTTFTESLIAGQSVVLRLINGNAYTITYPVITWVTATAPILTSNCVIVLWKEQATLYGAFVGSLV